jgi:hypothetical protein
MQKQAPERGFRPGGRTTLTRPKYFIFQYGIFSRFSISG